MKFYESVFPFKDNSVLQSVAKNDTFGLTNLNFFDLFETSQSKNSDGESPNDEEKELKEKLKSVQSGQPPSAEVETVCGEANAQQPHSGGEESAANQQPHSLNFNTCEADNADKISRIDETISPEGLNDPSVITRKSSRNSSFPKNLKDFIVEGKVKYGFERGVNYSKLSRENFCFANVLNKSIEPKSSKEALTDINWVQAMNKEMKL